MEKKKCLGIFPTKKVLGGRIIHPPSWKQGIFCPRGGGELFGKFGYGGRKINLELFYCFLVQLQNFIWWIPTILNRSTIFLLTFFLILKNKYLYFNETRIRLDCCTLLLCCDTQNIWISYIFFRYRTIIVHLNYCNKCTTKTFLQGKCTKITGWIIPRKLNKLKQKRDKN